MSSGNPNPNPNPVYDWSPTLFCCDLTWVRQKLNFSQVWLPTLLCYDLTFFWPGKSGAAQSWWLEYNMEKVTQIFKIFLSAKTQLLLKFY